MKVVEGLHRIIGRYRSAVVAFSGGVDSAFLSRVTGDILGTQNVLLVTVSSATFPTWELEDARSIASLLGLTHRVLSIDVTEIPEFASNSPERCYYCKRELFRRIKALAADEGFDAVFDGSNWDDTTEYRPGRKALVELGIVSPLCEARLTKSDIRRFSLELGLPTATKPSFACLASRFPYGEPLTKEKLERVGKAEARLRQLGLGQFRVRSHSDLARIELDPSRMDEGWKMRSELERICKDVGFIYVAIDTRGYRSGAMDESLRSCETLSSS